MNLRVTLNHGLENILLHILEMLRCMQSARWMYCILILVHDFFFFLERSVPFETPTDISASCKSITLNIYIQDLCCCQKWAILSYKWSLWQVKHLKSQKCVKQSWKWLSMMHLCYVYTVYFFFFNSCNCIYNCRSVCSLYTLIN